MGTFHLCRGLLVLLLFANGVSAQEPARQQTSPVSEEVGPVKIRIQLEGRTLTATLEGGQAARDFASLLPLSLTLKDYNATEKVSDLPKKLSTKGEPPGCDPAVGDLAYYAPWGNLAIFYRDFGYSAGLVRLGRLDGDVELLRRPGSLRVTIELAPN